MALLKCHECGNQVSSEAKTCPQCGAKVRKPTNWRLWGLVAALVIIAAAVKPNSSGPAQTRSELPQAQAPAPAPRHCAENECLDSRPIGWIRKGKEAVMARLKDPDSAKFRNVIFHQGREGVPVSCGEVNAKTSMGGYSGFTGFISAGKDDLTFMESDMAKGEFPKAWARFCAG